MSSVAAVPMQPSAWWTAFVVLGVLLGLLGWSALVSPVRLPRGTEGPSWSPNRPGPASPAGGPA